MPSGAAIERKDTGEKPAAKFELAGSFGAQNGSDQV